MDRDENGEETYENRIFLERMSFVALPGMTDVEPLVVLKTLEFPKMLEKDLIWCNGMHIFAPVLIEEPYTAVSVTEAQMNEVQALLDAGIIGVYGGIK
jgi:hypothetical protein